MPGIDELFIEAADLEGAAREQFLNALPDMDRRRIEELLSADSEAGSGFLAPPSSDYGSGERPTGPATTSGTVITQDSDPDATVIGPPDGASSTKFPQVDGYVLRNELARGGMGVVYEAEDATLGRRVALKLMLKAELASLEEKTRFEREARSAAKLAHRNVVTVFEFGYVASMPFLAMEFVVGPTLQQQIRAGSLTFFDAARIAREVSVAVGYAHDNGIVHRDLKPANILMEGGTTPRVTDFGLARSETDQQLTATEAVMGTPSYMAPEQAAGRMPDVGPLSDIYAIGAVLYACLTGRPPHRGDNHQLTLMQVLEAPLIPPRDRDPSIPRDLESICLKCLARQPVHRYTSANELAADLDRFLSSRPVLARPRQFSEKLESWVRRNVAMLAVVAVLVISLPAFLNAAGWMDFRRFAGRGVSEDSVVNYMTSQIESSTPHPGAYFARALTYSERQSYDKAIADSYMSLQLKYSRPASVWDLLSEIYSKQKRWPDVVTSLANIESTQALEPEQLVLLGQARIELGQPDLAIEPLSKSLSLRPDLSEAYRLRRAAYIATGDAERAMDDRESLEKLGVEQ